MTRGYLRPSPFWNNLPSTCPRTTRAAYHVADIVIWLGELVKERGLWLQSKCWKLPQKKVKK